ncbi:hypothetical protein E2542_SST03163 [Spatholobus suberectus]|nr:hypothetical protein E2542_SST03163 [Spatholobus suberectus]
MKSPFDLVCGLLLLLLSSSSSLSLTKESTGKKEKKEKEKKMENKEKELSEIAFYGDTCPSQPVKVIGHTHQRNRALPKFNVYDHCLEFSTIEAESFNGYWMA